VYVVEQDGDIAVFSRDTRSGRLHPLPGADGCVSSKARDGCAVAPRCEAATPP
jgi:hypothetical protein